MPRCLAPLAAAAGITLAGCGNMGDPLYPSLGIPVRTTDLRAIERGDAIIIDFTIPALTTDNVAIKNVRGVELRIGDQSVPVDRDMPGPVTALVSLKDHSALIGQEVVAHARVIGSKGHASDWSNAVTLKILPPLAPPADVRAVDAPQGVKLTWSAPGEPHFRISRIAPGETQPTQIGESDVSEFIDPHTEYGKTYRYSIMGVNGAAESLTSPEAVITTKDIFPPAVPTGLAALPGVNSVELTWDRNTEPDFKAYTVYRSVDSGPFERLAGDLAGPSYSDRNIQSGKHYRYAVSAADQAGNASKQSAPVEITAP